MIFLVLAFPSLLLGLHVVAWNKRELVWFDNANCSVFMRAVYEADVPAA